MHPTIAAVGEGELTPAEQRLVRMHANRGKRRLREIWTAIIEHDNRDKLPIRQRIKATPQIRGCGAAAKRAGF